MTYFKLMLIFSLELIIDNFYIEASNCILFKRKLFYSLPTIHFLKIIIIVAFAQIDWHDFVVVETVNFREEEAGINR